MKVCETEVGKEWQLDAKRFSSCELRNKKTLLLWHTPAFPPLHQIFSYLFSHSQVNYKLENWIIQVTSVLNNKNLKMLNTKQNMMKEFYVATIAA